jgi:hypothetical protein
MERMSILSRIAALISEMVQRRRTHWVEISVTRAWSRDMAPRLFDLGDS